nr:hypothetical protein CFP56_00420 [Quercus suber]
MAPVVAALAQSESKERFLARLNFVPNDRRAEELYNMMKVDVDPIFFISASRSLTLIIQHEAELGCERMAADNNALPGVHLLGHGHELRRWINRWLCKWLQEPEGQWQFTEQGSKASINMIGRHEGVVRRCGNGMRKWLTDLAGNKYKITASEVLMVPYAGSCHEISGRPCQLQPQRSVLKLEVRVHRFCPRSLDLSKMPVVLQ